MYNNVYDSYLKKIPQSRDKETTPEEREDGNNCEASKLNDDIRDIENSKHEHIKSSDSISVNNIDLLMHDEHYVEAVLYDLVNRNNPLPIVDKQGRRIKLTKLHKIPRNKLNRIEYEYEDDEEYHYDESEIRVTSTAAPISHKLNEANYMVQLHNNDHEKAIDASPRPPNMQGQLVFQAVNSNDHKGYEEFIRQLEKREAKKLKQKKPTQQNTDQSPAIIEKVDKVVMQSKKCIENSDSGFFSKNEPLNSDLPVHTEKQNEELKEVKSVYGTTFQQSYDSPLKEQVIPKIFDINFERGTASPVLMHNKYSPNKSPKFVKKTAEHESSKIDVFKVKSRDQKEIKSY